MRFRTFIHCNMTASTAVTSRHLSCQRRSTQYLHIHTPRQEKLGQQTLAHGSQLNELSKTFHAEAAASFYWNV